MTRAAWMLALSRVMVVAFFAVFVMLLTRPSIRRSGGCDEALAVALGLGSLICFAMMVMASLVHEPEAMRLHATEFLMLIGTAIVMLVERPADEGGTGGGSADGRCAHGAWPAATPQSLKRQGWIRSPGERSDPHVAALI